MRTMPTTAAQLLNLALCPTEQVRKASLSVGEDGLSFNFSYWLGVAILLQDRPCSPDVLGRFKQLLCNCLGCPGGLLSFVDACGLLRSAIVAEGKFDLDAIKHLKHRWVKGIVGAVGAAFGDTSIVHPSVEFDRLATFLGWLKRLPVCVPAPSEGFRSYQDDDGRLSSFLYDDNEHVPGIRAVWHEWFARFTLAEPFLPKHGSGSTADAGRVRFRKWKSIRSDYVARLCLRPTSLEEFEEMPPLGPTTREAKLVFVPKQAGKDRAICMEPAWLQYLQQGVAAQLIVFALRPSHPLRRYFDPTSQEANRSLCAQAYWRKLATIDLTAASDSVSVRLIRAISKGLPLWKYLYGTRSRTTLFNGRSYTFDKFAPMGSALCFPVESYLFSAIVEYSYRKHFGKASKGQLSGCSVYGDDIVVPQELYQVVTGVLESLGFQVNHKKSFPCGLYYESCGVEYCGGVRITTVRHPRRHLYRDDRVATPDEIGMVTDLANSLFEVGAWQARRILLKYYDQVMVRIDGSQPRPFREFIDWGPTGLRSINDDVNPGIWNPRLQRRERRWTRVQANADRSSEDFTEWRHRMKSEASRPHEASQSVHLRTGVCHVHEKWSDRGVLLLARMGHLDLLRDGDVEPAGTCRAGRLRYTKRRAASEV